MGVYLSLPDARILHLKGWGRKADPDLEVRIELADVGELAVYRVGLLREKKILSLSIAHLTLGVTTEQITTGGGHIVYGFGILGGAVAMLEAKLLNSLTTRWHEHAFLIARATLPNATQREAVFAFHKLDESELRDRLSAAITRWSDAYVEATLTRLREDPIHDHNLQTTYTEIDRMQERGMLDAAQALRLRSDASRPFVAAIMQNLLAGKVNPREAQRVNDEIDKLLQQGRLSQQQATQIHDQVARIVSPPAPDRTAAARTRQLEALAELRRTGALTEAEFQAEKGRLLPRTG